MDAEQGKLVGFEALLRWRHPKLGPVSPTAFIPLAEETGIIVPLGRQVLREACGQIRRVRDMGRLDLHIAVNVSPRQFREQDFVESVEQAIKEAGIPPTSLALELTESGVMEKPEEAIAKMRVLRIMGIRFSIDDFGTGYSSLSYLKRFPIDALKIDRSFVADALTDRDDREIVKTIVAMAGNLGIETVAEGIETREQLNLLRSLGCNRMQGFYYGRPCPATRWKKCCVRAHFPAAANKITPESTSRACRLSILPPAPIAAFPEQLDFNPKVGCISLNISNLPTMPNDPAARYFDYLAQAFPVMCASDEFHFLPRVQAAAERYDQLEDMDTRRMAEHIHDLTCFRTEFQTLTEISEDAKARIDLQTLALSAGRPWRNWRQPNPGA